MREAHGVKMNALGRRTIMGRYQKEQVRGKTRQPEQRRADGHQTGVPSESGTRRARPVDLVAREVVENLIPSGAQMPVVDEVLAALEKEFDSRFVFEYSLLECELQVTRETPAGPERLGPEEAQTILNRLHEIARELVDATMF
jgi:hypothetical protein